MHGHLNAKMCVCVCVCVCVYPSCIFKSTELYIAAMNFLPLVAANPQTSCYLHLCMQLLCAGRSDGAIGASSVPNSVTADTR